MEVDAGLVLYIALFVLFIWRCLCPWRCCGKWLQYANYCTLLYLVLFVSSCYELAIFFNIAWSVDGTAVWAEMVPWLKPLFWSTPLVIWITAACCALQTASHINAIRQGEAPMRHDRVVQVLALPVVYGTMAFASGVRMLQVAASGGTAVTHLEASGVHSDRLIGSALTDPLPTDSQATGEIVQLALSKSESAFMVADLYEAWVLYQFLKLTMELIASSIVKKSRSQDIEERAGAKTLTGVYSAVDALAWLGPYLFLLICGAQAGWSLYVLIFATDSTHWSEYESSMAQFKAAGFLASCAAIWNIAVVETSFHHHLEGYSPMLKFVTVKILVSFAFFQRGLIGGLQVVEKTMPRFAQSIVRKMPILGDVLHMGTVEFEIFYAALIIYECWLIAGLHWFAWGAEEEWYSGGLERLMGLSADPEKQPLLKAEKAPDSP